MQSAPDPPPAEISVVRDDLRCSRCGYSLRGLARDGKCPECGMEISLARPQADTGDPLWRISRGVAQLFWLGFLVLPVQLWIDDVVLRLLAAAGNLLCAFWATAPAQGETADDPHAWERRAGRVAACALALLAAYAFYCWLTRWTDWPIFWVPPFETPFRYSWLAAIAASVVVTLIRLRRIAQRAGFGAPAAWLVRLAWISAIALALHTMLTLDDVPDDWQHAARIARSAISRVQGLAWTLILLLCGRLHERISDFLRTPGATIARSDLRVLPRNKLTWGIALAGLLLPLFGESGLPYSQHVLMIGYAIGVWLIASAIAAPRQFPWQHAMRAGAAVLVIGTLARLVLSFFEPTRPSPRAWQYPVELTTSLLLSFALAACAWTSLAALEHAAGHFGQPELRKSVARRKWLVSSAIAAAFVLTLVLIYRPLWFDAYYFLYGVVEIIVLESTLILGRAWQSFESRPTAATSSPAS